jgi:hypothetical protein
VEKSGAQALRAEEALTVRPNPLGSRNIRPTPPERLSISLLLFDHMTPAYPPGRPSSEQLAAYAAELLETLRKMATSRNQVVLAHLLALAAVEARALAKPMEH